MIKKKKIFKKLFFVIISIIFSKLKSETISNFIISGNERVADETIIIFSTLNIGDKINSNKLNEALKKLYYTDYFKNVELSIQNQTVNINVIENPIIQSVVIEGVDVDSLYNKIKDVTSKIEKVSFCRK